MVIAGIVTALTAGGLSPTNAQFGYTLPQNDFVWRWGDENRQRGMGDLSVNGSEAGFNCELVADLGPGSRYTVTDVNQIENELRVRLDFIYAATTLMNQLDLQNDLDWAVLTCERPQAAPVTPEEKAENEARARDKMQREIERRRARQQKDPG
jgi:hypothetical protein